MGFMPSPKQPAEPVITPSNTPGLTAKTTAVLPMPDELLTRRKYVINTQNNRTGVDTQRLNTVVSDLRGFAEGSYIKVTYYKVLYPETDTKGKYNQTEGALSHVHKTMLKINGFEMKMLGPLSYNYSADELISSINGEAVTYPGFEPEKHDRFVMEIDTGKYAMMEVAEVPTRLAIRANTYFKIQFKLTDWMSETEIEEVDQGVADEAWFDKARFLHEPGALLYHDEYVELKFLKKQRAKMVNYYRSKFLDEVLMYSYVRPDKVYDPYVTDFMLNVQDISELGYYAKQLYENAPFIKDSIWAAIRDALVPLESVPTLAGTKTYVLGSKTVLATSLLNKRYVYFCESAASLADYFDELTKEERVYVAQIYPVDFNVTSVTYALTKDVFFRSNKNYYLRSGEGTDESPYQYTITTDFKYGAELPADTYYEADTVWAFKPNRTYYTRTNGVFTAVKDTTDAPDPSITYYLRSDESATDPGTTTPGGDPTVPDIPGGTNNEERTLGDLLLHLHPHYRECPLTGGDDTNGSGDLGILDIILNGSNEHIDLLRMWLLKRSIDLRLLHACIENVWKLPKLEQFYKMPLYMYLADRGMQYIHYSEGIFEQ